MELEVYPEGIDGYVAPKGVLLETIPGYLASDNGSALTSGKIRLMRCFRKLRKGTVLTNLQAVSGPQAAVTPTNWWMCLVNAATLKVLAVTADQLNAAWATNTRKSLAIANGPYRAPADLDVMLGIMVAAATPPLIRGGPGTSNLTQNMPSADAIMCDDSTAGRTGPPAVDAQLVAAQGGTAPAYLFAT